MLFVCVILVLVQEVLKKQTYNDKTCSYLLCLLAKQVKAFRFYGMGFFVDPEKKLLTLGQLEILLN